MIKSLTLIAITAALITPTWAGETSATTSDNAGNEDAAAATETAGAGNASLAAQLANPLAALISVPFQFNYDTGFGAAGNGNRWLLNIQPVIPFTINDDWNLISRTIIPVIDQSNYTNPSLNESGLGDITQSLWASPSKPINGWTWGVGAAFLLPTSTADVLGSRKWGAGPTAIALRQTPNWTYGVLANHINSFAGDSSRNGVNGSFIQPFLVRMLDKKTTLALNTETTYAWDNGTLNTPINLMLNRVFKIGGQSMQAQIGARYWAVSAFDDQEGSWGLRAGLTFIFPK